MLAASWWQDCGQWCTLYTHVYDRFISWWPPWGLAKWVSNDIPLVVVGYNLRLMLPLHGYCVTNHEYIPLHNSLPHIPLFLNLLLHLKMNPTNPYPTLHRNWSQNLIPRSLEMDPKISYPTLQKWILKKPISHYHIMKVHSTIFISNTFDRRVMQLPNFSLLEYENISLG